MPVALLSYCCENGVGLAGFDFFSHLPFARWIVIPHRRLGITAYRLDPRCYVLPEEMEDDSINACFEGIDTLFCIERKYYPSLLKIASQRGIRTIVMPNAEWLDVHDPEIMAADKFIAPTVACFDMLQRTVAGSRTEYIPHPIDTERFTFALRSHADVFLHCHGWGGYKSRKGTDIVLKAASACGDIPFVVRSQKRIIGITPANVTTYGPTAEPEQQYDVGSVCIQPSRWEGVGLQILEAMACGLPTLVPDAPPMNEYQVDRTLIIPATGSKVMIGQKEWVQWEMDHQSLTMTIRALHNQPIADLSLQARRSMELRSWRVLRQAYVEALDMA